ncbi:MAG TPA: GrpB family protein [Anaerolineae bacterium]
MCRKVEVVPHSPDWPQQFRQEAERLAAVLKKEIVTIHHFGSTAIPDIPAKPTIDILVEVRDIGRIDDYNEAMIQMGYEPKGEYGITGRRFFRKEIEGQRTHHVHIYQVGNPEIERHLNFRDYMRVHPTEAAEYGLLKKQLAQRFPEDMESYVAGKTDFVRKTERKARLWRDGQAAEWQ